jgi:hypothetical protein
MYFSTVVSARRDLLDDRQRDGVEAEDAILGVIDDVDELVGKQPRVHGVQQPRPCRARRRTSRSGVRVSNGERADRHARLYAEPRERHGERFMRACACA